MSRPIPGQDHRFDTLTSALNQAAYNEDIKQVMDGVIVTSLPIACARLDVDKFKSVNDTFGHSAGDEALRHIAAVIRRVVRERDRVYRISGDEFGVLFLNFTEEEGIGALRRVGMALQTNPVRWVGLDGQPKEFTVSVSVGVAEAKSPQSILEAFGRADQAAYVSKGLGKGVATAASTLAVKAS
jgi:diguanylate cyclase (GGDEF)-like protein